MATEAAIRIAVDAAYPPYMYGIAPAKGLYPEIIRTAFSLSGIPVAVSGYPWKRALSLGREGKVAIGGIYQNLARMARFDYSDPIYRETLLVCVKTGHGFPFNGVVDLIGKRIGINRGWSYGEVFAKHTKQAHVLDRFNQGLVKMKANGTNKRILDKFIHGAEAD